MGRRDVVAVAVIDNGCRPRPLRCENCLSRTSVAHWRFFRLGGKRHEIMQRKQAAAETLGQALVFAGPVHETAGGVVFSIVRRLCSETCTMSTFWMRNSDAMPSSVAVRPWLSTVGQFGEIAVPMRISTSGRLRAQLGVALDRSRKERNGSDRG